ncbi:MULTISPECIES: hypothetical protein [unclassified Crossiella]|nr:MULTISPECIES: hypothetical protein [unclassified Crossiella]
MTNSLLGKGEFASVVSARVRRGRAVGGYPAGRWRKVPERQDF